MKTVYKSSALFCLIGSLFICALVQFNHHYSNEYYTFPTVEESIYGFVYLFIISIPFVGAFCKTVIETDDGFEIHYMYGFQKKWFGKDFLVYDYVDRTLLLPDQPHRVKDIYIKFWDGGKKTYIYQTGTRRFEDLKARMEELAQIHSNKTAVKQEVNVVEGMKPNIKIIEDFTPQSFRLFHLLKDSVKWDERMKARKTASFGVSYDYSGITYPQTEMLEDLVPLCKTIEEEFGFYPNNCLMNYYPDGNSSLGFHSDSSEELKEGTGVAIISLGTERAIHYKNIEDRTVIVPFKLNSGALLYMGKDVQEEWLHAIPKDEKSGARISLSFREIIK